MSGPAPCAVVFTAREQAELRPEAPDTGPPGPHELKGVTLASLVSAGTELMGAYLGEQFPRTPGYAAAFRVDEVGSEVSGFAPGDVAFCMGAHRSHQRVPAARALRVPEGVSPQHAPFARMLGVSWSTLVTTAARPPDQVLVTGLGLVGHLAAHLFAGAGYEVAACDPHAGRRSFLEATGALAAGRVLSAVPVGDPEYQDRVSLVLECSGHEAAAVEACRLVRKKGEVALIGAPWLRRTEHHAHELLHAVFFRYVVLRSGWEWELPLDPTDFRTGSIYANYAAALRWMAEGRFSPEGLATALHPRDAQAAYQDLLHQRTPRLAVLFDWTRLAD